MKKMSKINVRWSRMILLMMIVAGLSSCSRYKKIPVTFRRAPLVQDLDRKTLVLGTFTQKSPGFQAVSDISQIIQRNCEKNQIFRTVKQIKSIREWENEEDSLDDILDAISSDTQQLEQAAEMGDYLLVGAIKFLTRDRSGNDFELVTNRYGYVYPKRVYRERMGYVFELGLVLIDLTDNSVLIRKTKSEDGVTKGGADSISLFFQMVEPQLYECMDELQGKKIRTKRYLLYK